MYGACQRSIICDRRLLSSKNLRCNAFNASTLHAFNPHCEKVLSLFSNVGNQPVAAALNSIPHSLLLRYNAPMIRFSLILTLIVLATYMLVINLDAYGVQLDHADARDLHYKNVCAAILLVLDILMLALAHTARNDGAKGPKQSSWPLAPP